METLSLIQFTTSGFGGATFAQASFTTAPPFAGPGNTISKSPYTPTTISLLVPKNSLTYALFEAGLRDNLRMRIRGLELSRPFREGQPPEVKPNNLDPRPVIAVRASGAAETPVSGAAANDTPLLVIAADLLAPLASASRPVWINIDRASLDAGPDCGCAEGVPSSDLSAKTLRDLRIPYKAVWKGLGCFNRGVYRIQIEAATEVTLQLDCEKLCLHDSDNPKVQFAYACLCGDHELEITLADWICDKDFNLDVYRIR